MLDAQFEYCAAGQPVVLTPFLLMGAMSPVTIPAALTQQLAEALSGIALAQLIRPGCPVIFGSFLSNIDMQSGSPSFGTPESAIGLLCTGQLARHYGLPFRTGGGLNSSQTADAQSAYEALMTLLPTFLAGTNFVMHAAGWLEGGLVSCYEKFIIDIELLRELRVEFTPLEITEESLAFGAHEEVGHGGHFLGAEHTMERFRDCFYRPMLSSTANFERWLKLGGKDTAARAGEIWRKKLDVVRGAAAGRRHPRRAGRLRDPPPPRTRRLAPRPPAARERTMGATRGSAGMQEACDGPATASADRGVEFVTPGAPERWDLPGHPAPRGSACASAPVACSRSSACSGWPPPPCRAGGRCWPAWCSPRRA